MAYELLFATLRQIFATFDEVQVSNISASNVITYLIAMTKINNEFLYVLRDYVARNPNCVNETDINGMTPLLYATRNFINVHPSVIGIVITGYERINEEINGMTPLGNCVSDCYGCTYATFKLILEAGADPNQLFSGNNPLVYASSSGRSFANDMVLDLINAGGQCIDRYKTMPAETAKKIKELSKPLNVSTVDVCAFCMDKKATVMNAHPSCAHVLGCEDCYLKLKKCHICDVPFTKGINISSLLS